MENKIAFYELLLNVISTALATAERKGINILSPDKMSPDNSNLKDELNRIKG